MSAEEVLAKKCETCKEIGGTWDVYNNFYESQELNSCKYYKLDHIKGDIDDAKFSETIAEQMKQFIMSKLGKKLKKNLGKALLSRIQQQMSA